MRISSSQYFNLNVSSMNEQQSTLAQMYSQISSGKKLQTASDDPVGAAQAVTLTMQSGTLSQYSTNQATALSSLQQEDSVLSTVGSVLQSIQTQVVHAGDGSLNDADRGAIANTLQGYRDQLLGLANTTDSGGNYIFAGLKGSTAPFTNDPSGVGTQYDGDMGTRGVQISSSRTVPVGDPGAAIFQSVSPSESTAVSSGSANNTGTGTISAVSVDDVSNANNRTTTYTINFATASDGSMTYTVSPDPSDPTQATSAPAAYTADSTISLGGESVKISGSPANNDSFTVQPGTSGNNDMFATLDNLISALRQPTSGSDSAAATLTNALTTAGAKLTNSYNNVLASQTTVGGREQEVQAQQSLTSNSSTQNASDLANLTSIDLVSSISSYELTQSSLQAAQMAFSQIQKMSLFDYLSS
jgi:flagellar hook-associated protein 3 FlgL